MFKAGIYIMNKEGIKGFYRGYFPALFIYSGMFWDDLIHMLFHHD
jgi:hypothetical protein